MWSRSGKVPSPSAHAFPVGGARPCCKTHRIRAAVGHRECLAIEGVNGLFKGLNRLLGGLKTFRLNFPLDPVGGARVGAVTAMGAHASREVAGAEHIRHTWVFSPSCARNYRGTSLIRNLTPPRTPQGLTHMPSVGPSGVWRFLMSKVPSCTARGPACHVLTGDGPVPIRYLQAMRLGPDRRRWRPRGEGHLRGGNLAREAAGSTPSYTAAAPNFEHSRQFSNRLGEPRAILELPGMFGIRL